MSSGNHPETDGSTERVNRVVEEALRCYINYDQSNLFQLLPDLQFALNDYVRAGTEYSPFEILRGSSPLRPVDIAANTYSLGAVQSLAEHFDHQAAVQSVVRDALRQAQAQYVYQANKHRRATPLGTFRVGDRVYVHRGNFVPPALRSTPSRKLQPRYFGPYTIDKIISSTSYRVRMPANVRTHPVFHASQLKLHQSTDLYSDRHGTRQDPLVVDGNEYYLVDSILDRRKHRRRVQYLVKWKHYPISESTWEPRSVLLNDSGTDVRAKVEAYDADHP